MEHMSARLIVDEKNGLTESRDTGRPPQPAPLRYAATLISWVFHPVFVPVYLVMFMVFADPYLFAGFSHWDRVKVVIQAFVMFTFFPVVSVLLLRALNFISSFYLRTQKDRIIPFIACGIWYFWIWYVWRNLPDYPKESVALTFAVFLASWFGLMLNITMKVSMHTIGMGTVLTFLFLHAFRNPVDPGLYLTVGVLATGLVATARFIVSDHTAREIYTGLFAGAAAQLIAFWIFA